jgi:tRNA G10  N-methylase Trm11
VAALVEYYGISSRKAREALTVLTEDAVSEIVALVSKGGKR